MEQIKSKIPAILSGRKVSVDQAIKLLRRNGIQVNEDQALIILDFLYLLARTYGSIKNDHCFERKLEMP